MFPTVCNDVGKLFNTTETQYFCKNKSVSALDYNKIVGQNQSCSKRENDVGLCYCPKDYSGQMCETKIQTVCRFETVNNVLIKLILNGKDLYKNYNTFYDEYLNNSFSSDFDKEMLLNYYATIKCITPGDLIENYYYKNPMTTINNKNKLFQNFTYFIDKKNVTISKQPKLAIIYRLYDMRSLLPKIEAAFPLDPSQYIDILTGEIKYNLFSL